MFETVIAQIGVVRCALLFGTVFVMLGFAHYLSFRQALAAGPYEWKAKPVRSLFKLFARHETNYLKKVPVLIGVGLVLTVAACYL